MAGITGELTNTVIALLQSPDTGINVRVVAMGQADSTLTRLAIQQIAGANMPVELTEASGPVQYPSLSVYCDKVSNSLREKFREFSGTAHVVIEVRHSQPLVAGIAENLQVYVDAVCGLLNDTRGDWGGGFFYSGGYDVVYEPVGRGGKNYLQRAKVGVDVEVSR